jgi:plastocyanin
MRSLVLCLMTTALVALPVTGMATSKPVAVKIDNYAFLPASITVPVGTTVTWKNLDDDPHTATADDKTFDSKGLAQGDTFSFTFTKPGTYRYHCSVHPFMKATITVRQLPALTGTMRSTANGS